MSDVDDGSVDVVSHEGAGFAACVPICVEHEVLDDELAHVGEQVAETFLPIRAFKSVVLFDHYPRQCLAGAGDFIAGAGVGFFLVEQFEAGFEPFVF